MGWLSADPEIAKVGARDLVMEARDTHPTDPDAAGCRRLFAAVLRRAMDDLVALVSADSLPLGERANKKSCPSASGSNCMVSSPGGFFCRPPVGRRAEGLHP